MTLQQVIDLARTSELNGLSLGKDDGTVIGFLNLGLLELYKRFPMKMEEYIVDLQDNQTIYTMPDDFMWIVAAYGEVPEDSTEDVNILHVNEEDNPESINTISWNKIQVPISITGAFISIIYVASPTTYTMNDLDVTLDLPPQMIDALLAYIGYKANSSIDSGVQTEDNVYFQRFMSACNLVEQRSMINSDDMFMSNRISDRGFA